MGVTFIQSGRFGAAGFSDPTSLPNLALWLDASDASTFTYSSDSVVSQWNDKSGNSYHATQGTVADQPSRTGTQNSLSTVVFDGTTDHMTCGDVIDVGLSNITMVAVVKKTSNITAGAIIGKYKISANAGSWLMNFERSGGNPFLAASYKPTSTGAGVSEAATPVDTHRVFDAVVDRAAGSIDTWIDGASVGSNTFTADSGTNQNNAQAVWIGRLRDSADTGFYSGYNLTGEIAEIIVYQSALSTTDRQSVEAYLKTKWGTA